MKKACASRENVPIFLSNLAEEWIKINYDATLDDRKKFASLGCLARDCNGALIGISAKRIRCQNVASAEGLALVEAIQLTRFHRWRKIILETDAEIVSNGCTGRVKTPWSIQHIVEEIKGSSLFFEKMKLILARRSANQG